MNYIDLILVLLLLFAAINGFRKGLVSELASLAALVLGVWGAIEFSHLTTEILTEKLRIESDSINIISFIITFVVIIILVHLVGSSLTKLIEVAMLGWLNRITGMIFGFLKTALILSVLLYIFNQIDEDIHILPQRDKAESQLYEPVKNFAPMVFPFIGNWVKEKTQQKRSKKMV